MISSISPVLAAGIMDLRPGLTLWTAITFICLLFVLSKYAWKPMVEMLDARERSIRDAIEKAKQEREEAQKMLAEQKEALAAAQREAAKLAERSRQDVELLRADLAARARKEAEDLIAASRRQIQDEKAKALVELKHQVVDLAIDAARGIIKSSLDDRTQRKIVEEYIAQLPSERAA